MHAKNQLDHSLLFQDIGMEYQRRHSVITFTLKGLLWARWHQYKLLKGLSRPSKRKTNTEMEIQTTEIVVKSRKRSGAAQKYYNLN